MGANKSSIKETKAPVKPGKDSFWRKTGASSDVAEIEYIIALATTLGAVDEEGKEELDEEQVSEGQASDDPPPQKNPFPQNSFIKPQDIQALLRSRYGVQVPLDDVCQHICHQGWGVRRSSLDALHIVAALLIPCLWNEQKGEKNATASLVLTRLLEDCTGSAEPPPLTPALLRLIFRKMNLTNVLEDDGLVEKMIQAVQTKNQACLLDTNTFLRGLTNDLAQWEVRANSFISCPFEEAIMERDSSQTEKTSTDPDSATPSTVSWQKMDMFSAIDFSAGTFYSRFLTLLLWASFLLTYVAYFFRLEQARVFEPTCPGFEPRGSWSENRQALGCMVAWAICRFLYISIGMGLYGLVYIGGGGLGNLEPRQENLTNLCIATVVSGVCALLPFLFMFDMIEGAENLLIGKMALVAGLLVFLWNIKHLIAFVLHHNTATENDTAAPTKSVISPLFANRLTAESWNKQAACHKADRMLKNAIHIAESESQTENIFQTNIGRSMYRYVSEYETESKELVGGFGWTWRRIQSGEMFAKEGVWYSGRLLSSNFVQLLLVLFVLVGGITLTDEMNQQFDDFPAVQDSLDSLFNSLTAEGASVGLTSAINRQFTTFLSNDAMMGGVCPTVNSTPHCNDVLDLANCILNNGTDPFCTLVGYNRTTAPEVWNFNTQNRLLALSGLNVDTIVGLSFTSLEEFLDDSIATLYPEERYMLILPMVIATATAVITAIRIFMEVLPATTTLILKFRCGEFPSLRDPSFYARKLKSNKRIPLFMGQMFWGTLVSCLLMALIFGGFAFFMVWQVSRSAAQNLMAFVLGIFLIVATRELSAAFTLVRLGDGYYRRNPMRYNWVLLARETGYFAVSFAFLVVRAAKVLVAGLTYAGRIHRRILSQDAGDFASLELDPSHDIFLATILQHEAHRHPYLDILSLMYATKILHPQEFATTAGCAWRLLFTAHLFPWLRHVEQENQSHQNRRNILNQLSIYKSNDGKESLLGSTTILRGEIASDETNLELESDSREVAALRDENERLRNKLREAGLL